MTSSGRTILITGRMRLRCRWRRAVLLCGALSYEPRQLLWQRIQMSMAAKTPLVQPLPLPPSHYCFPVLFPPHHPSQCALSDNSRVFTLLPSSFISLTRIIVIFISLTRIIVIFHLPHSHHRYLQEARQAPMPEIRSGHLFCIVLTFSDILKNKTPNPFIKPGTRHFVRCGTDTHHRF
jgi:hypothetical protein